MPLSIRRALAALIVVAIFGGVSASAAGANTDPSLSLRTQVDLMGTRYFAAKNAARVIDDKLRSLDRELAITEHRVAALQPMAKAATNNDNTFSLSIGSIGFSQARCIERHRNLSSLRT